MTDLPDEPANEDAVSADEVDETILMDLGPVDPDRGETEATPLAPTDPTIVMSDADEPVESSRSDENYWRPGVRLDARIVPARATPPPEPPRRTALIAVVILVAAVLLTIAIVLLAWSLADDDESSMPALWPDEAQLALR